MKTFLINILYRIARMYFDEDLFARVEQLVVGLIDSELPGETKRELVKEAALAEFKDLVSITGKVVKDAVQADPLLSVAVDAILHIVLLMKKTRVDKHEHKPFHGAAVTATSAAISVSIGPPIPTTQL